MKKDNINLTGKDYWRSLDQLSDTPQFKKFLHSEFPESALEFKGSLNRRKFLTLMGASMAMAGLTACRKPVEKIVPYVKSPEEILPGIPQYYATTMPFGLNAYGLLVESHEGRPTKIEGNELHPSSLGKANSFMQAALLGLYDPDRSQKPKLKGNKKEWIDFLGFWKSKYSELKEKGGEGFAILTESFSSPALHKLKQQFTKEFPKAKWYVYEPVSYENLIKGLRLATGSTLLPNYYFDKAKVILSLDSDFMQREGENIINANGFIKGRKVKDKTSDMNRLYVVESNYSTTGGMADHRKSLPVSQIEFLLYALIEELKNLGLEVPGSHNISTPDEFKFDKNWLAALAKDLLNNKSQSIVIAGKEQPKSVHALVFVLNSALGNNNKTIGYLTPQFINPDSLNDIIELSKSLDAEQIETVVMLGGNPVYTAPADLKFAEKLSKAKQTIHLSEYYDETSQVCAWHLPKTHFLESWGDACSTDGTLSVIQPLIEPLFGAHSDVEILNLLNKGEFTSGYDLVRETWIGLTGGLNYEKKWQKVLHDGVFEKKSAQTRTPVLDPKSVNEYFVQNKSDYTEVNKINLEILFQQSPAVYDGRFTNNGWLQELPDMVTKLTWGNAVLMSNKTAEFFGLKNEDLVELDNFGSKVIAPVWIQPGHADFSVTVNLGYGRSAAGRIGNNVGFNANKIRSSYAMNYNWGLIINKAGGSLALASVQDHGSMEGRPLVRESSLQNYKENGTFHPEKTDHPPLVSLWEEHKYEKGYQWGMVIDLNSCVGCNACTVACQSENNVPVVGKEQVIEGREMHWIRIDRYFAGEINDPEMVYQPVACQHCEMAPCEQVCPVQATSHDEEGLNVMTYNRCIGTRYCSNNCPYKVRRFNFFNYTADLPEIVQIAQNPNVTIRSRGVMEKCTYCLQRINQGKIIAKREGRELADGEVKSACQQTCPTDAISFGNVNDPKSQVSQLKKNDRNYAMLEELNIKPRTSYLAKLRNPNPEIENS
jgi:molybdopterin-containing oxidoreductase family iron-sulfur binding subunit